MHLAPQPWERAAWAKMAARPACGHTQAGDGISLVPSAPRFPFGAAGWLPMLPALGASHQGSGGEEPAGAGQPQP